MSTVPLKESELILPTAAWPPRACSYLLKTSSTEGSGAGAAAGFAAGAGPDIMVAGALLGDMVGSRLVKFVTARVGKISMADFSVGALSPGSRRVDAALAAPRWHV